MAEIQAKLEARIAHHKQQVAFHKQQEAHPREQSAAHAVELDKVKRHFEVLPDGGAPGGGSGWGPVVPAPVRVEEPEDLSELVGKRIRTRKLIAWVVHGYGEGDIFGASRVAADTNRRYSDKLKRPVDARSVSTVLRRRATAASSTRPGSAAQEALCSKVRVGV